MTDRYWKVLGPNRTAHHGGTGQWAPQAWMPTIPDPEPCVSGYHLCRRGDLVSWLGPAIWEAKAGDVIIDRFNKVVTDRARLVRRLDTWNDRTARLFAADCAERALTLVANPDSRSVEAIRVARLFANGEATKDELSAAARAAAGAASVAAAWAAAEREWQTNRLMHYLYPNGEPT